VSDLKHITRLYPEIPCPDYQSTYENHLSPDGQPQGTFFGMHEDRQSTDDYQNMIHG
jgi:hypothetical protein